MFACQFLSCMQTANDVPIIFEAAVASFLPTLRNRWAARHSLFVFKRVSGINTGKMFDSSEEWGLLTAEKASGNC